MTEPAPDHPPDPHPAPLAVLAARRRLLWLTGLRWSAVGLVLPVVVLAIVERGIPLASLGLLFATMSLTTVLLEVPTGGLADGWGRRPVLVLARLAALASTALVLAAREPWVLVPAGIAWGTARALDTGPLESWYVDLLELDGASDRTERDLARVGLVTNLAIAGGSLLAGVAGALVGAVTLPAGLTPLDVPLVLALLITLVDVVAVVTLLVEVPRTRAGARSAAGASWAAVRDALSTARRRVPVRGLLGAELAWGVAIAGVEILWQPRVEQLLPGVVDQPLVLGVISALGFGAGALGSLAAERAAVAWPGHVARSAALIRAGHGLAILLLVAAGGLPLLVVAYVLSYVGNGGAAVLWVSLLHRQATSGNRASLVSIGSVMAQAGGGMGSLALPALAAAAGIGTAWIVGGVVMTLSAPLFLLGARADVEDRALAQRA